MTMVYKDSKVLWDTMMKAVLRSCQLLDVRLTNTALPMLTAKFHSSVNLNEKKKFPFEYYPAPVVPIMFASGDKDGLKTIDLGQPRLEFRRSKELETANEMTKTQQYCEQIRVTRLQAYKNKLKAQQADFLKEKEEKLKFIAEEEKALGLGDGTPLHLESELMKPKPPSVESTILKIARNVDETEETALLLLPPQHPRIDY